MFKYHMKEEKNYRTQVEGGKGSKNNGTDPNIAQLRAPAQSEHCASIYEARTAPLQQ